MRADESGNVLLANRSLLTLISFAVWLIRDSEKMHIIKQWSVPVCCLETGDKVYLDIENIETAPRDSTVEKLSHSKNWTTLFKINKKS